MSWKNDLPKKVMAEDRDVRGAPCYLLGTVVSPLADGSGPLIISTLDGNVMLTEGMVDRLCRTSHLREGMTVALLRGKDALIGGQRFFVQEIPGHGDILGRDAEDSHPIGAITGLRAELDDHNDRLIDLETRRVKNLEHDMNDSDGKVPLLTVRVGSLETGKANKGHTHSMSDISGLSGLEEQVAGIAARGGEANVIETVKRNGTALAPDANKAVDIAVPEKVSDLTNDSGFQTAGQVQSTVSAGVSGKADSDRLEKLIAFLLTSGPIIFGQPQDVVAGIGKTAVFPVEAEGNGLTYQWYYRNPRSTGENFAPSSNTTDTYSVKANATTHSQGFYVYCVVTDSGGRTAQTRTASMTLQT